MSSDIHPILRYQHRDERIRARIVRKFFVSKESKSSLVDLKEALDHEFYYESIRLVKYDVITGAVHDMKVIHGDFQSDVYCNSCYLKYGHSEPCTIQTPNGSRRPLVIYCFKCNTNYMDEIKEGDLT
jgi:hypothetical protein